MSAKLRSNYAHSKIYTLTLITIKYNALTLERNRARSDNPEKI